MFTYDDLQWLMREGILTIDAHFDSEKETPMLTCTWSIPEHVLAVIEDHKTQLYIEIREKDGARIE